MGLLKWFKNFRSRSKSTAITSILDYFPIPKRVEFQDDREMLSLIDQHKSSYLDKIRTKEIYYSGDIGASDIRDEMQMYTNLLFRTINNSEDADFSFDKVDDWNKEESKVLDYNIKTGKLSLYLERLITIKRDIQARMVALDEILNENKLMFPRKKRAVLGELNNLIGNFIAVSNQILASEKEQEAFKNKLLAKIEEDTLKNLTLEEIPSCEIQKRIEDYHHDLMDMISVVLPEKEKHLEEVTISNIIMAEYLLEVYVYKNSKKVEELFAELKELEEDTRENSILKANIYSLEMKFKAFAIYGDKLITREDLFRLYKLKFRIFTDALKPDDPSIVENANLVEVECYEEIVFSQINDIVRGNNPSLSQIILPIDIAISEIKKVLQNDEGKFSPWYILSDNNRLLFLLAFNGNRIKEILSLNDRFAKYSDDLETLQGTVFANDSYFFSCYERRIPLKTIFYIAYLLKNDDYKNWMDKISSPNIPSSKLNMLNVSNNVPILDNPLFILYMLYAIGRIDNPENTFFNMLEGFIYSGKRYFHMWVGYTEFSGVKYTSKMKKYKDKLNEAWKNKIVVFPRNIHVFDTDFFDGMRCKSIVLSEGLDAITKGFNEISCDELVIPSSLETIQPKVVEIPNMQLDVDIPRSFETIKSDVFKNANINTIIFEDYLHSRLTKDSFLTFIRNLTYGPKKLIFTIEGIKITLSIVTSEGYADLHYFQERSFWCANSKLELDKLYNAILDYIEKWCMSLGIDYKQLILQKKDKHQ